MPRNASGVYSLPTGNPVTTGTAISSTVHNATLADLAAEVQDSLSRSGKGGMLSPFLNADGTLSEPGISFTNDTDTGIHRSASNTIAIVAGGNATIAADASGATVDGTLTVNDTLTVLGGIPKSALAAVGQQISSSCGAFTGSATSATDVTNLSVTITTTGRPIIVALQPDGANLGPSFAKVISDGSARWAFVYLVRDATTIVTGGTQNTAASPLAESLLASPIWFLDAQVAGTYTYKIQYAVSNAAAQFACSYMSLVAYEL